VTCYVNCQPGDRALLVQTLFIGRHIAAAFPKYHSHHSRAENPNKKILNASLTLSTRKMPELYKVKYSGKGVSYERKLL
jgi:hypothetical protein